MTQKSPNTHDNATGERIALFPGSFNPFTTGHASIVERGLQLFDRVVIAIGISADKPMDSSRAQHAADIRELYSDEPRVTVLTYSGLTVNAAKTVGARFLLRGVRSTKDFEYERDMADINRQLSGIETVLLYALPTLSAVSSSVVRELEHHGQDISAFIPTKKESNTLQ